MLPQLIQDRKLMIQDENVLKKLNEIDLLITEKGINEPIRMRKNEDVGVQLAMIAQNVSKDIGLKKLETYDLGRFIDVVIKYYSNLSVPEIKLAFELLLIGELDNFLPKDRNREPDKNHYQVFSFEYVSKVLRAYVKKKNQTWGKVQKALPKLAGKTITEQDKKQSRERFIKDIKAVFDKYRDYKKRTVIYLPALWVDFFRSKKMINIDSQLDIFTIKEAYKLIVNKQTFITEDKKREIVVDYERGIINNSLQAESREIYCTNLIYEFFDYVIKQKKDLKELI